MLKNGFFSIASSKCHAKKHLVPEIATFVSSAASAWLCAASETVVRSNQKGQYFW